MNTGYGVATISRLLKSTGLFCRISSLLQGSSAKETYNFKVFEYANVLVSSMCDIRVCLSSTCVCVYVWRAVSVCVCVCVCLSK